MHRAVYAAIAEGFHQRKGSNGCISGVPKAIHGPHEIADTLAAAGISADHRVLERIITVTAVDPYAVTLEELYASSIFPSPNGSTLGPHLMVLMFCTCVACCTLLVTGLNYFESEFMCTARNLQQCESSYPD